MDTYHTNIHNIKSRMENQTKPTLHNMYGYLLDRLAILYKDKSSQTSTEKIDYDISQVFETLQNYEYEFINYSEENKHMFIVEEVEEISNPVTTKVAILENGKCIVKGKYYQPKK